MNKMMKQEQFIEKYLSGNLKGLKLKRFEMNLKSDKLLQQKLNIYKNVDELMKIPALVTYAEIEMKKKHIDKIADKYVADWMKKPENKNDFSSFLNISMS